MSRVQGLGSRDDWEESGALLLESIIQGRGSRVEGPEMVWEGSTKLQILAGRGDGG